MNFVSGARNEREAEVVPLSSAVFCLDCEVISQSRTDECPGCHSRSLLSLGRILGGSLHDRLAQLAPGALSEALELLDNGYAPRIPQDSAHATYAPKLTRESGRIDWSEPAEVIERKIRAFNPWPGAFAEFKLDKNGTRKMKVFSARTVQVSGKPGQILRRDSELIIAAGTGALSVTEVQLEGRKRMSAADLIRGNQWIATASAV